MSEAFDWLTIFKSKSELSVKRRQHNYTGNVQTARLICLTSVSIIHSYSHTNSAL